MSAVYIYSMASTRNKNTRNNYALELNKSIHTQEYLLTGDYAQSTATACPGNGLGVAHIPRSQMSNNPVEIENFLFGIGSSDLTKDVPVLNADLKCLPTHDIFTKAPTVVSQKFVSNNTQRPQFK
jgi:hypothetical protein